MCSVRALLLASRARAHVCSAQDTLTEMYHERTAGLPGKMLQDVIGELEEMYKDLHVLTLTL